MVAVIRSEKFNGKTMKEGEKSDLLVLLLKQLVSFTGHNGKMQVDYLSWGCWPALGP